MADTDSGFGCFCNRVCLCCNGPECSCSRCKSIWNNFISFVNKKFISLTLVVLCWTGVVAAYRLIEDPDWNIAIVPYLCTCMACALMSVTCKRGHYDRKRSVGVCRPQENRRPQANDDLLEIMDSEVSPLLSSADRNDQVEKLNLHAKRRPVKDPEELFEPPRMSREQVALRRNSQVIVQADVHQAVNEPSNVPQPTQVPEEHLPPCPISPIPESSSNASDPPNLTSPDSGVALQSTGQSTQSSSDGPVDRPSVPDPETLIEPPSKIQQSFLGPR